MNRKLLSEALDMIDDEYIAEFVARRSAAPPISSERNEKNMNNGFCSNRRKKIIAIAVAACVALSVCFAASAAKLWGIRSLMSASGKELPENAEEYITPQSVGIQDGDWSCRITESLCSGREISVAVEVTASDKFMLIPVDSSPADPAASLGIDFDGTVGEYAASRGREPVNASACIRASGSWEPVSGMMHFERISDSRMVILAQAAAGTDITAARGVCSVYAGSLQADLDFEISAPDSRTALFVCTAPDAVPGVIFGDAIITENALGTDLRIRETVTDYDLFSLMEMRFEQLTGLWGGSVNEGGSSWTLEKFDGQGSVGDTLTLNIYNVETGEHIGDIVFERLSDMACSQ